MAEHIGWKPALTAALSKVGETIAVEQITLTAPLAYTLPAGTPSGVVHSVVFTQNNVGGHAVTYGGSPVTVDTTAGAQTEVELWPNGAATRTVVYPGAAGSGVDTEAVQDIVGAMVTGAGGTYNDAAGTITLPAGTGAVDSVNGQTGAVLLDAADVGADPAGTAAALVAGVVAGSGPDPTTGASGQAWVTTGTWAGWATIQTITPDPLNPGLYIIGAPVPDDDTAPSVPTGLTAVAASQTAITLTWTASTDNQGVTGYEYRINGGTAIDAGAGVSESVTGLSAGTEYTFNVRAYDAAGNRSGWSASATASTDGVPAGVEFAFRGSSITPSISGVVATFAGLPIGTAAPTRTVIAAVTLAANGVATPPTITINGAAVTIDAAANDSAPNPKTRVYIVRASVPTGETCNLVVTHSSAQMYFQGAYVWTASGTVAVADTLPLGSTSNTWMSGTITGSAGGYIVGGASTYATTAPPSDGSITGLTSRGLTAPRLAAGDSAAVGDITLTAGFAGTPTTNSLAAVAYIPA